MESAYCAGDIRGLQVGFGEVGPGSAQCTEHLAHCPTHPTQQLAVCWICLPSLLVSAFLFAPPASSPPLILSRSILAIDQTLQPHQVQSWLGLRETCPEEDYWALSREPRAPGPGSLDSSRVEGSNWKAEVERGRG